MHSRLAVSYRKAPKMSDYVLLQPLVCQVTKKKQITIIREGSRNMLAQFSGARLAALYQAILWINVMDGQNIIHSLPTPILHPFTTRRVLCCIRSLPPRCGA